MSYWQIIGTIGLALGAVAVLAAIEIPLVLLAMSGRKQFWIALSIGMVLVLAAVFTFPLVVEATS